LTVVVVMMMAVAGGPRNAGGRSQHEQDPDQRG
jgi:hypothetical protein